MAEETISSKQIFNGKAVRLRVDTVQTTDGRRTKREIVEHEDCVAVVALDADDNILLVKQFRTAVGEELLEIPAGGIDPGEDSAGAVRREMREETGYLPQKVECIGGFYSAPGYSTEFLYLYLATDLVHSPLYAEDTAAIELVRVQLNQIPDLLMSGKVCDSKTIAGLFFFLRYRETRP